MPDEPPEAVIEALDTCRRREHEAKLGREIASKHSIVELLDQVPLTLQVGDTSELAQRLDKAFDPFRTYCLRNGIERLDQVSITHWSHWIQDGLHSVETQDATVDDSTPPHATTPPSITPPPSTTPPHTATSSHSTTSPHSPEEWNHAADTPSHRLNLTLDSLETKPSGTF